MRLYPTNIDVACRNCNGTRE